MKVLVDYDNLPKRDRARGLRYCLETIASSIVSGTTTPPDRLEFRLYGGWYSDRQSPTTTAQQLQREIAELRTGLQFQSSSGLSPVIMSVALADSLLGAPANRYFATVRRVDPPGTIGMRSPASICRTPNCRLAAVAQVISSDRCNDPGCSIAPKGLLYCDHQKMVDTMICVDLLYLTADARPVAVVSGDDDLWPAIHMALLRGIHVTQVYTKEVAPMETARISRAFASAYRGTALHAKGA